MNSGLRAVVYAASYARAVQACREAGKASVPVICSVNRCSHNGALEYLARMQAEGVIGAPNPDGEHELTPL